MLYSSEHEMMYGFFGGLALPFYLASEHLIAVGYLFPQIIDHETTIERAYIDTYGGENKRLCHQCSVVGIPLGMRIFQWSPASLAAYWFYACSFLDYG